MLQRAARKAVPDLGLLSSSTSSIDMGAGSPSRVRRDRGRLSARISRCRVAMKIRNCRLPSRLASSDRGGARASPRCRDRTLVGRNCNLGSANQRARPRVKDMVIPEHTAKAFDVDLQELSRMVAEMGGLTEKQIADAVDALSRR